MIEASYDIKYIFLLLVGDMCHVKIKMYKNQAQRKFATKFDEFQVIDNDGEPVSKSSVRYGDKVRIKYNLGNEHPVHGTSVYLQAVRVVEKGEVALDDDGEF